MKADYRINIGLLVSLMGMSAMLLVFPGLSWALDPFDTESKISLTALDISPDQKNCDRDKISRPLNLTDVVDLVLCNNPQTRALWAASRAQAAQLGVSTSAYLPSLTAQANVTQNYPVSGGVSQDSYTARSANLTAGYLLYDFGGRSASLDNARQLLIAANATRNATLQANYLSAVQAYYGLLSARATVKSLLAAEASARESLAAAEARYKAGVATPVDKLQAQTTLSQATYNRINAEGNERSQQGSLATLMGFDARQAYTLIDVSDQTPDPAAEQDIGILIEQARKARPDLQASESQIQAAEAQLESVRASGRPSISLGAVAAYSDTPASPDFRNNSVGVTVSVPLFSGFKTAYQEKIAQAQLEGKIADRDKLSNQVALEVWNAYQALLTSSSALRSADDLLAVAIQSEKMILGRYKAGVGNILDTLSAQSALANARQQRVTALYNFLINRFALAQSMGELDLTLTNSRN